MVHEFKRRRMLTIFFALLATAIIGGHLAFDILVIPNTLWPLKLLLGAPALVFAALLPGIYLDALAPGPVLTISAEGIRYLPFSRETVPWTAVHSVTLKRGYSHQRGANDYYRFKLMDGISFVVSEPERFPVPPLGVRANNIPVSIMRTSVQASPDQIADAVRACWNGSVEVVNDAPSDATLHGDES